MPMLLGVRCGAAMAVIDEHVLGVHVFDTPWFPLFNTPVLDTVYATYTDA